MATEAEGQVFPITGSNEKSIKRFKMPNLFSLFKKVKVPKPGKKQLLLGGIGIVLILFLTLIIAQLGGMIKKTPPPAPVLTPTPIETSAEASPSAYATDSAVLKIEKDIIDIEEALKRTIFREPSLLPPEIDLNVEF